VRGGDGGPGEGRGWRGIIKGRFKILGRILRAYAHVCNHCTHFTELCPHFDADCHQLQNKI
jgi:hypothetical protein